jgi:cytochrome b561
MLKNTTETYGSVAKLFHWTIFLLIATLLVVGFRMTDIQSMPDKFFVYGIHKSLGITVLLLVLIRLGWKMANVQPILPASLSSFEKFAAHAGHVLLYMLIIAMPLSGWMMSSASGFPVSVFGWFTLPDLVGPDKDLKALLVETHYVLAWAIIVTVTGHALAALLHHFYHKNNVLRRMLPFAAVLLFATPAMADVPTYTMVKEKSSLKFIAIQNGAPVTGEFKDFTTTIHFDKDALDKSSITAEVNIGSVSVENADVLKNVTLPEWLSAAAFPKATFVSKKISRMPLTDDFYAEGTLTLKGKTVPVMLNFQLQETGNVAVAKAYITLKRSDFNIGEGEWSRDDVIGNAVRVELRIFAEKTS